MFGRLHIPAGQRRHLCLATDAIQNVGQLEFVEVVTGDSRIEKRFIKTGRIGMRVKSYWLLVDHDCICNL